MRAVVITSHGGPEVLVVQERAQPQFGDDEVLIEVKAVGVNRADIIQRKGFYPAPPGVSPDVPGLEYAGIVAGAGKNVDLSTGMRVMGLMGGGTYQDFICVNKALVMPIPQGLDCVAAAALPEAFVTAYDAAFLQAELRKGETLVVTAAASGVGVAAGQLAKVFGCRSIGTVRQQEKAERLKQYFDHVFLVEGADFADKITALGGSDVVLDLVGGDYVEENLKAINKQGRIMVVGLLAGAKCQVSLNLLLAKRATIKGTTLRARSLQEKAAVTRAFIENVLPHFESGLLKPEVDSVFALEEAHRAHQFLEDNKNFGKVVLDLSR